MTSQPPPKPHRGRRALWTLALLTLGGAALVKLSPLLEPAPVEERAIQVVTIDRLPAGRPMFTATAYVIRDGEASYLCEDYGEPRGKRYCHRFQAGHAYAVKVRAEPSAIIGQRIVGFEREL